MTGRSQCRFCHHQLAWYDLVPVFSFVALRGHCRYCKTPIHLRYPIVEISMALTLTSFFWFTNPSFGLDSTIQIFALLILVSLFFFDLFYLILPDVLIFPAIAVYAIYDLLKMGDSFPYFMTALLIAGFFAILYGVSGGKKLGFGDVKLTILLGLMLGYPLGFVATIGGVWLAAIFSLSLLLLGRAKRTDPIPLGSFLVFSTIICIIFYNEILPITTLFQ